MKEDSLMYVIKVQKQNNKILLCIVIFLITIVTTDTVYMGTNINLTFQKIPQIILSIVTIVMMFFALLIEKKFRIEKLFLFFVLILCIVLSSVLLLDFRIGYIFKCVLIAFSFLVTQLFDLKIFAGAYNKVIAFLAGVSLICFAIEIVEHDFFSFAPRIYNSAGYGFRNLFVYVQSDAGFSIRNYGIYREPGVYQLYLIVALLFEIYCFKTPDKKKIFVYLAAIVTTLSSTGIIALLIWIVLIYVKHDLISDKVKIGLAICGGLACIVCIFLLPSIFIDLVEKFFGKFTMENPSFLARWGSIVLNIKIWAENPFTGVGLSNIDPLYKQESINFFGILIEDNTNTLLAQFAVHGTLAGLLWMAGYFRGACVIGKSRLERVLICLMIIALSIGENLTFSPLGNVLMMYGLMFCRDKAVMKWGKCI